MGAGDVEMAVGGGVVGDGVGVCVGVCVGGGEVTVEGSCVGVFGLHAVTNSMRMVQPVMRKVFVVMAGTPVSMDANVESGEWLFINLDGNPAGIVPGYRRESLDGIGNGDFNVHCFRTCARILTCA